MSINKHQVWKRKCYNLDFVLNFFTLRNEKNNIFSSKNKVYKEITFEKISSKTSLDIEYLENLIENLIISKEIDAVINGDTLIFRKTIPESKKREMGTASKK